MSGLLGAALRVLANRLDPPESDSPVGDYWTTYLAWMFLANAGMLARGNVYCLDYAIRHLPSASPILEIGSFCGLSANTITYLKGRCTAPPKLDTLTG